MQQSFNERINTCLYTVHTFVDGISFKILVASNVNVHKQTGFNCISVAY
jgi:hypothetical protein